MGKNVILGTFYLKNGNIVEEKLVLEDTAEEKEIDDFIKNTRDFVAKGFQQNLNFHITFGHTTFRGADLAAFTMKKKEN